MIGSLLLQELFELLLIDIVGVVEVEMRHGSMFFPRWWSGIAL